MNISFTYSHTSMHHFYNGDFFLQFCFLSSKKIQPHKILWKWFWWEKNKVSTSNWILTYFVEIIAQFHSDYDCWVSELFFLWNFNVFWCLLSDVFPEGIVFQSFTIVIQKHLSKKKNSLFDCPHLIVRLPRKVTSLACDNRVAAEEEVRFQELILFLQTPPKTQFITSFCWSQAVLPMITICLA